MNTRKSILHLAAVLAAAALGTAVVGARPAKAQIDIGTRSFELYENGTLVGQVYREGSDPSTYVEHWVMYPDYVYPSQVNGVRVVLQPGTSTYESASDFLARVPFERGSRYARAAILDAASIPGR